ncbi:MAG: class I SAM-dependent methyltransferase [Lachnospiraceae bacterium]|nr:class I SAM-dependent methyltransferase [Lachnospiraceae bacterium]
MAERESAESVTRQGNPRKPQGDAGTEMLRRMNESHWEVTGWALSLWQFAVADRVQDIGCGGGATLCRMAEQVPDGHLTGVDYSPVSVALSRETNAEAIAAGRMEIREASVENLPFEDGSFDKIITVESFYFWPDPQENLREVRRVLAPGGRFFLVADIYQNGALSPATEEMAAEYQLFNPTKEEFRQLFERAGFSETVVHTKEGTSWICVEGRRD